VSRRVVRIPQEDKPHLKYGFYTLNGLKQTKRRDEKNQRKQNDFQYLIIIISKVTSVRKIFG
jgi:hypothetical protein